MAYVQRRLAAARLVALLERAAPPAALATLSLDQLQRQRVVAHLERMVQREARTEARRRPARLHLEARRHALHLPRLGLDATAAREQGARDV